MTSPARASGPGRAPDAAGRVRPARPAGRPPGRALGRPARRRPPGRRRGSVL